MEAEINRVTLKKAEAGAGQEVFREQLVHLVHDINLNLLQCMFAKLQKSKPAWAGIIEHWVAILRNVSTASADDVKKYLNEPVKLHIKLDRLSNNPSSLTLNIVRTHLDAIKAEEHNFKAVKSVPKGDKLEDGHVRPIIDWALAFGELAIKVLS